MDHRRILMLLVASALVVAVSSGEVIKCYMCNSLSNEGCDSALTTRSLHPVECTGHNMVEWQRTLTQHRFLNAIANFFVVDDTIQHNNYPGTHAMACAKMTFTDGNQEVIVRSCQLAKTESIDPCKVIEGQIQGSLGQIGQKGQIREMKQCSLCLKDACNGATVASPGIFYTLLLFLGSLIHVLAFYHWA